MAKVVEVRSNLCEVPSIEVGKGNFVDLYPSIIQAIKGASFVALDTELSGLGKRSVLNKKSLDDRYKALCEVVTNYSVISLGISCFKFESDGKATGCQWQYLVQNFSLLLLCNESYMVEPLSLKFLIDHNFDFNRQYSNGISYYRGDDKVADSTGEISVCLVRELLNEIVSNKKPVVLHNGLVDLMFLHHNLFAAVPASFTTLTSNLAAIFTAGIIDTKYLAEFELRISSSYLEFCFRWLQQRSLKEQQLGNLAYFRFLNYAHMKADWVEYKSLENTATPSLSVTPICPSFAYHGWCPKNQLCSLSHDVNLAVAEQERTIETKQNKKRKLQKRKMRRKGMLIDSEEMLIETETDSNVTDAFEINDCSGKAQKTISGSHRASMDAFMTGYILATFIAQRWPIEQEFNLACALTAANFTNKVYLAGKETPLVIQSSPFTKVAKNVSTKLNRLLNGK